MKTLIKTVKQYNGEEDIGKWLDRAKVIAEVANEDLAKAMPMLLEGKAYDVWVNLDKSRKCDIDEIKSALKEMFQKNDVEVFDELKQKNGTAMKVPRVY